MPNPDPDYYKYELYGVVIHRGSANGGHYYCYTRDVMSHTNWEKGIIEAKEQEEKIKAGSETKDKPKSNEEATKEYSLKEPTNKKLL